MSGSVTAGLAAALVILTGCRPDPGDPTAASSSSDGQQESHNASSMAVRGVALSPRSYEAEDFSAFLDLATAAGDVLAHVGDWRQLQQPSNGFEAVVRLGRERGLIPLTVVSASSAGALIRPLDDTEIEEFLATLEAFVAEHRPDYLGIGNEVNMLATDDPASFDVWKSVWPRAVEVVRTSSPETTIFPVLQFEWLIGRRDGLFGREIAQPQWEMLAAFDGADAIGITTFPALVHSTPDIIPDDYFVALTRHTDLPVIITETGWPSDPNLALNPGSEATQAAYVDKLATLVEAADVIMVVWPFVYDTLIDEEPFGSYGLRRPDGSARPAWRRWVESAR